MSDAQDTAILLARIKELELENNELRSTLAQVTSTTTGNNIVIIDKERSTCGVGMEEGRDVCDIPSETWADPETIMRYSRHLILPEIGTEGQEAICNASILVIGAGGLGSSALLYLAAAGVGRIGIVDDDCVDISNLQRQVIHGEDSVGRPKVESAANRIKSLNSSIQVDTYHNRLSNTQVMSLCQQYDIIIDAVDNAPTRYMLSDACVLLGRPLVSGSALGLQGQMTVYGYQEMKEGPKGPCYRCLHPTPPPVETMGSCSDNGVLGVVPGLIGCLQAVEALKIILNSAGQKMTIMSQKLLIFDATSARFIVGRMRGPQRTCAACGETPSIDPSTFNYAGFCHMDQACEGAGTITAVTETADNDSTISVQGYRDYLAQHGLQHHTLLDVRSSPQFKITRLSHAISIPLNRLTHAQEGDEVSAQISAGTDPIFVICRRGIDSATALPHVRRLWPQRTIQHIAGGLHAWHHRIDGKVPLY